jgi:4-diphosphocytidyl-2-C-methyl-D-erythritol kinase
MITQKAYAKVNLSLRITGKREDGYHLLDTLMQTVSLYDTVSVEKSEKGIEVVCNNIYSEDNICYKACKLFFEKTGIQSGVKIVIDKKIPVSAGLGGGSADAAAVLRILNNLYGDVLSFDELCELGLKLGADVPFCIKGGTARVNGIGEKLEYINPELKINLVLLKLKDKPSTAQMYKEFDAKGKFAYNSDTVPQMAKSLEKNDFKGFCDNFYNDFVSVWDIEEETEALLCCGAEKVSLSGSGPTVMGVYETKEKADVAAEKLSNRFGCVYSVTAVNE